MIHVNYEIFFLRRVGVSVAEFETVRQKLHGHAKTAFSLFTLRYVAVGFAVRLIADMGFNHF